MESTLLALTSDRLTFHTKGFLVTDYRTMLNVKKANAMHFSIELSLIV